MRRAFAAAVLLFGVAPLQGESAREAGEAAPAASTAAPAAARPPRSEMYKEDGPVVNNVASFIGLITVLPATAVTALVCPAKMAATKSSGAPEPYKNRYQACISSGVSKSSALLYEAGGFPLFMLKKVFWDAPKRLFSRAPKKPAAAPPGSDGE